MRISYWCSDVCSSDLRVADHACGYVAGGPQLDFDAVRVAGGAHVFSPSVDVRTGTIAQNWRASMPAWDGCGSWTRPSGPHTTTCSTPRGDIPNARHSRSTRPDERRVGKECVSK